MTQQTPKSEINQVLLTVPDNVTPGMNCMMEAYFTDLIAAIQEHLQADRCDGDRTLASNFVPIVKPPQQQEASLARIDKLMTATFKPQEGGKAWARFWHNAADTTPLTLILEGLEMPIRLNKVLITENSIEGIVVVVFREIVLDNFGFSVYGDNFVLDDPIRIEQRRSLLDAFQGDPQGWFK